MSEGYVAEFIPAIGDERAVRASLKATNLEDAKGEAIRLLRKANIEYASMYVLALFSTGEPATYVRILLRHGVPYELDTVAPPLVIGDDGEEAPKDLFINVWMSSDDGL